VATSRRRGNPGTGYGDPVTRFWKRVDRGGPLHPVVGRCWQWLGGRFGSGYGLVYVWGKNLRAHRYSWELHNGPVPDGLRVMHNCDNRLCVNPAHLSLGTDVDNIHDMMAKGRDRTRGYQNGRAAFTPEVVAYIRNRYRWRSREDNTYTIAKDLGVSQTAVMGVVRRVNPRYS
jgi:hypothetical protein